MTSTENGSKKILDMSNSTKQASQYTGFMLLESVAGDGAITPTTKGIKNSTIKADG